MPPDFTPTARQRDAIEAPPGPALVLAGPGAGKTFCLIERIRYLIAKGHAPARLMAVTFTNKAAGEIADRLRRTIGAAADEVYRSTIHALSVDLLREYGEAVGVSSGFGIADEEYQRTALRRAGFYKDATWPLTHFSRHRLQHVALDDWLTRLYQRYREILARRELLDFDDLLVYTELLLRTREEIATEIAARWDHLLVDEGQDLNPLQYAILSRLARDHHNIMIVGDDEQSIFSWAGADPAVLVTFLNDHRIIHPIVLDENRRSSKVIFETARRLIAHNPKLHEKALRATRESPWPVLVQQFADEHEEANWLLADLVAQQEEYGLAWGDIAILYRRHDAGDALETRLVEAGIPCQLAQGRALADDPVVRYLLAALRLIHRPADPIFAEQYARAVLPTALYAGLRADADREKVDFLVHLRRVSRGGLNPSEDARKLRRFLWALGNLPAMAERHPTLRGLVEELLSQRVGEYRSLLEEKYAESLISDPLVSPEATQLAAGFAAALDGRARVWLPRRGGAELGVGSLLRQAGLTMVDYLDAGRSPQPGDLVLTPDHSPLTVFKALQVVHGRSLRPAFDHFVAVDIETSDLDLESAEVVELAAVKVRDGRIVEEFQRLVRPAGAVSPAATAVHGYAAADLADAPDFASVWTEFRAFAGDEVLIAHNGHGFDFPVLERLANGHPAGDRFPKYDSLPLARDLHPGSRKLGDLARAFGIDPGREHHGLDDTRTLARVMVRLEERKLARARATSLGNLLDHLAVALALAPEAERVGEAAAFLDAGRIIALGRYSQALPTYESERSHPGAAAAPDLDQLIERLGGRRLMERLRREKRADDRYPAAMARLRRLLDSVTGETLQEQLSDFLERVALSQSNRDGPETDRARVNLLTLHSTKGLEFSRVYIVGVEDTQLPGAAPGREPGRHDLEEGRRLLYVGMSRAKDRLVMTRAARRNDISTGGQRYLEEMGLAGATVRAGTVGPVGRASP